MSKSKSTPLRWLLALVRYGLCVGAIVYLVYNVPWHDQVHLKGPPTKWVRLTAQHADRFEIVEDGQRRTVDRDEVVYTQVNDAEVPEIMLGFPSVVLQTQPGLGLWAVLIFLPVSLLQSYRLVVMLRIQDVRISFWNAIKLTFAGNFFNFALPGMTGGDLIKAYYVTHYTHKKTEVVTTVILDRAIGLLGLVLLAGIAILMVWNPTEFGSLIVVLGLICVGLLIGAVLIFSKRLRHALGLPQLAARLPFGEQLLRIGRATVAMRHHKLLVVGSLLLTFTLQILVMISAYWMALALNMRGPAGGPFAVFMYFFIYVAIGFLVAALPISPPQAVGVMEFFYLKFFTAGNLNTASQAVALAVALRIIQLVWALPGVLVPLFGAHLPNQRELAELEAEADAALPGGAAVLDSAPAATSQ